MVMGLGLNYVRTSKEAQYGEFYSNLLHVCEYNFQVRQRSVIPQKTNRWQQGSVL